MTTTHLSTLELTGIGVIDDQHQAIFDQLEIFNTQASNGDRQQIGASINQIVSQTLAHFEFEEELMEQSDYPFLKVHKRLHDYFIQHLVGYTQRFDAGEDIAGDLAPFLNNWLHNHFTHEDRDYSPQVLAEIEGKGDKVSSADNESWISRTLQKIA